MTLRERREQAGLSRQRLAELAGCSMGSISLYESGYAPAAGNVRRRVERALATVEHGPIAANVLNAADAHALRLSILPTGDDPAADELIDAARRYLDHRQEATP